VVGGEGWERDGVLGVGWGAGCGVGGWGLGTWGFEGWGERGEGWSLRGGVREVEREGWGYRGGVRGVGMSERGGDE
jgi:hypothetical protein